MECNTTADLISAFEEDQRKVVFSALSDYLHLGLFTDISLTCGVQMLRAHKVVLAASSKFFRDAFKHCPSMTTVDLDKELAPHGLSLTFDDVQLVIGILYCVGTVEISSQRVESLLLIAQVMGIPSLISFLKRVRDSVIISNPFPHVTDRLVRGAHDSQGTDQNSQALLYLLPPSTPLVVGSQNHQDSELLPVTNEDAHSIELFRPQKSVDSLSYSSSFTNGDRMGPQKLGSNLLQIQDQTRLILTPPSRSGSRATLASLGSFSIQPIQSPTLRDSTDLGGNAPAKGVASVLEGFDPSFLSHFNNLQATQIDDLENVLLPHLHASGGSSSGPTNSVYNQNQGNMNEKELSQSQESPFLSEENLGNLSDDLGDSFQSDEPSKIELSQKELNQLQIVDPGLDSSVASMCSPGIDSYQDRPKECSTPVTRASQSDQNHQIYINDQLKEVDMSSGAVSDKIESASDTSKVVIEKGSGTSLKFTIPGTSNCVTVDLSAEIIDKMRRNMVAEEDEVNVTSSTPGCDAKFRDRKHRKKKKESLRPKPFSCQLCQKSFSKQLLLDKHSAFHVEEHRPCQECGKVFDKKWQLQQHIAIEHERSTELQCQECNKKFKWHRNLLAHMATSHQREVRYRCRLCPLTFLRKKSYIKHHQGKHASAPDPWCQFCFEIFENVKQGDDHRCDQVENTGRVTICHKHKPPIIFHTQQDLQKHLQQAHPSENISLPLIQKSCPVCHKKFLLRKNLVSHMKRIHESEGQGATLKCKLCPKTFYYDNDRQAHENTHKDQKEKDFVCEVCPRSYSSKKALNDHMNNAHSGSKELHSCTVCGKILSDKYKLKYHLKVHSDKKNFRCSHCTIEFKAKENLMKHIVKFHPEKVSQRDSIQ